MFTLLLMFLSFSFVLLDVIVPPSTTELVVGAVGVIVALVLHFGPIPTKIVTLIGSLGSVFALILPRIDGFLPPRIGMIIAIIGVALAAVNGRIQGSGSADNPDGKK